MRLGQPYYFRVNQPEAERRAKAAGLKVVRAKSNELQLDIDQKTLPPDFEQKMELAINLGLVVRGYTTWHSKSGNIHVVVKLPARAEITDRILLQAVLGSDWKREMLNYYRFLNGDDQPSVLFKP